MGVREYIGARYTIKVYENSLDQSSCEWEAGVAYEPITMVTYNNSSYLSKKAVPAAVGDPASNPEYWIVTGAYNGQILDLQTRVKTLEDLSVDTIDDLKDLDINSGIVYVRSYYTSPIDGGGYYSISVTGESYDILLDNGYYAHLLNEGFVTAEQFGALADNSTDNTAAVQAADDYCEATGASLVFRGTGTYLFNDTINKSPYTSWYGSLSGVPTNNPATNKRAKLKYTGSGTFISFTTDTTIYAQSVIENISIEGIQPFNSGSIGIKYNGYIREHIYHNVSIRFFETGFSGNGAEYTFDNCYVWYCKYNMYFAVCSDSWFKECHFGSGLNVHSSCSGGVGLRVESGSNLTFMYCRPQTQLGGNGAVINGVSNVKFIGCTIDGNENIGLQFVNCDRVIVEDCEFHGNKRNMYFLASTSITGVIIGANHVYGINDSDYAIEIAGSGTMDRLVIHDNVFNNLAHYPTVPSDVTTVRVANNVGMSDVNR